MSDDSTVSFEVERAKLEAADREQEMAKKEESNWLSAAYSDIFRTVFRWGMGAALFLGAVGYFLYLLARGGNQ